MALFLPDYAGYNNYGYMEGMKNMAISKDEKIKPLVLLRKNVGLSRNKAAVMLDIGLTTLARYENGDNDVPFGVGEKMAVLYAVPFDKVRFAIKDTKEMNSVCNPDEEGE